MDHSVFQKVYGYFIKYNEKGEAQLLVFTAPDLSWRFPGGTVEPGEDLAEGLRRELREETGITQFDILRPLGMHRYYKSNVNKHVERHDYLLKALKPLPAQFSFNVLGGGEDAGSLFAYHWMSVEDIEQLDWEFKEYVTPGYIPEFFALRSDNESFLIRPIQKDELDSVLNVYIQCEDFLALGPENLASMNMVEKDMQLSKEAGGMFCGIFTADGQMVGIVDFVREHFEGDPTRAFILLLMIARPERRKGLGMQVVRTIERVISQCPQVTKVFLGVQANNPGGLAFWQKAGYDICEGPTLCSDGTTVFKMYKPIHKRDV